MTLVLVSASPRRRELLRAAGLDPLVRPASVDERLLGGESPADAALRLASAKARAGAAAGGGEPEAAIYLGADTLVDVEGLVLGKPRDAGESRAMIERLSGRSHAVHTGVSLVEGATGRELREVATTEVSFTRLSADEIDWYVASGEGRDKAGAYAVQGLASLFVTGIQGSYTNVVGLPMDVVYRLLGGFHLAIGRGLAPRLSLGGPDDPP